MPREQCVTTADAEHFVRGLLDEEASSVISAHLTSCADCRGRIDAVGRNLRFAERLTRRLRPASDPGAGLADRRFPDVGDRYEIVSELGRGGSAVVYKARQRQPSRFVAVKILSVAQFLDRGQARLVEREARVLALLRHPNLAAVHDAGRTGDGRPYLVMELVEGVSLLDHAARDQLTTRQRLGLFLKVCEAVAHAHRRGVIHRDLKPTNILVARADGPPADAAGDAGSGEPKVLDFGLARLLDADESAPAPSGASEIGTIVGTVPYMSPEQVRGDRDAIDVRTDVYALGVVLYELLTGLLPYAVDRASLPAAARTICEAPPRRPASVMPSLRGDLETIMLKALEKEPDRRYSTVSALADDLRRFLAGEPIAARPATLGYQLGRLIARHRAAFSAVAAAAAILVTLTIALAVQAVRLETRHQEALDARRSESIARTEAEHQARIARAVNTFLNDMFTSANPERRGEARETKVIDVLDDAATALDQAFADEREVEAGVRLMLGGTYAALGQYAPAEEQLAAALQLRRLLSPADHEELAQIMNKLGRVLQDTGRYDEAEGLFRESLAMKRRLLGAESTEVAKLLNNLGWLLFLKGEFPEAEARLREALDLRLALLGEEHGDVASTLNNLAVVLMRTRRLEEAERMFRRSIEIDRRQRGEEHINIVYTMANHAMVLADLGRLDEAETAQRDALDRMRRILGEEHFSVALTTHNLAWMIRRQDRPQEAEPLYRQALDVYARVVPEDHPRIADTCAHLGAILAARGACESAEPFLRRSLDIRRARLGLTHPSAIEVALQLAEALHRLGRPNEAADLLTPAVEQLRLADPPPVDLLRTVLILLVDVEDASGRTEDASAHREALRRLDEGDSR